ncbi:zinc ribbon domain-containing protein [Nocardia donostiensis]|uniref:zinc ribbon domain-containing protein n=1 Tax=Nocardia donostiensis TaxID=1538463 RepID=UPI00158F4931|nr:zinc ribbon domain-containing protein [Nocardia donostiensis]
MVIEDLHVAVMVRNRRLVRHFAGVGMGELRRQLEYKADWHGARIQVAGRWYPSSTTCSACGVVKAELLLSERIFTCDGCGLRIDRDLDSARNLAALAEGRPPRVAGRRRHRKASTQDTLSRVS